MRVLWWHFFSTLTYPVRGYDDVVVLVKSPQQTPKNDPEKRLRVRWRCVSSTLDSQRYSRLLSASKAVHQGHRWSYDSGADPARNSFRPVDQMLSATNYRVVSTIEDGSYRTWTVGVFAMAWLMV